MSIERKLKLSKMPSWQNRWDGFLFNLKFEQPRNKNCQNKIQLLAFLRESDEGGVYQMNRKLLWWIVMQYSWECTTLLHLTILKIHISYISRELQEFLWEILLTNITGSSQTLEATLVLQHIKFLAMDIKVKSNLNTINHFLKFTADTVASRI